MPKPYEQEQQDLNPDRPEQEQRARQEAEDRLRERGIEIISADSDEDVADLLDAIERFETEVEAKGGDLFVDRIGSSEPAHPDLVPPERRPGESAADYRDRIDLALGNLRGRS